MKSLKIFAIISYLLICRLDQLGFPIFAIFFVSILDLLNSLIDNSIGIFWEGLLSFLPILTLIFFYKFANHKNRYYFLLCFFILLIIGLIYSNLSKLLEYKQETWLIITFIIPFTSFIISSSFIFWKILKSKK